MKKLAHRGWVGIGSLVLVFGCASSKDREADDVEGAGTDAATLESDIEALGSSFVSEGTGGSLGLSSGGLQLHAVGDGARAFYLPLTCLTVTPDAAAKSVTYVLDNCRGRLGLHGVSGTITADYSQSTATELRIAFASKGLKVNRALVDWSATANITASGETRTMVWDANITGTSGNGRELSRRNKKTISWIKGTQCITANGQSQGNLAGRELTTVIENYQRCEGECPEAGGKITISGPNGSVSIVVLGGGYARAESAAGTAEFRLPCSYL